MASESTNHFWDSCTLIRHLTQNPPELLGDIQTILDEAKSGKRKIWHSTLLYAEFRPSLLKSSKYSNIADLIADMEGVLLPIAPNPNIMLDAGKMRDYSFQRPQSERQSTEKARVLTVADAVQLATCLYVKRALGVDDLVFNTFDDGKGRNYEEKAVSLLRFEQYVDGIDDLLVKDVCLIPREKPELPQPRLT